MPPIFLMKRLTNIELEYQPPIVAPPIAPQQMAAATISRDDQTINFWKDIWVRNMASNKEKFKSFKASGLHLFYEKYKNLPVICMGSGPSLQHYAKFLTPHKDEQGREFKGNPGILVMSALHNFAYLTDLGVHVDFWATLDGGEIVIDEMFDGASKKIPSDKMFVTNLIPNKFIAKFSATEENAFQLEINETKEVSISFKEKLKGAVDQGLIKITDIPDSVDKDFYSEKSRGQKIIAYVGTNPRLWDNWKGDIIWTQSLMPNPEVKRKMDQIEKYEMIVSSGGNVLGASAYIAKAIFGCNPLIFMGADFSFSYEKKFHSFDSKYDTVGQAIRVRDIYGNAVWTWSSYYGFKQWFDLISMQIPGIYINCSDGCMGAYETGNLTSIIQKHINDVLEMYRVSDHLKNTIENIDTIEKGLYVF